ncbi:elongation factor P maturation arginine rhamnosyltransferase EarP [Sutterella sp.]|uniref:elongation factor P maturation arginine rhamnosyltransferase EarP n=1 Tax=Sutterella sp. TaxID=1981025 RepID=UPI0026DFD3B6|nr:elongation factor P maturation arginine rhamnosyltransferase EarP [Sutterella sp.]MDO5531702.1 elongation factor P maturation arginine rhamnosyltransferase EarP [Sutterella sp.]
MEKITMTSPIPVPPSCDVFCRVIDNFGDAGVCWRLARRFLELGVGRVRFITDHPEVLALIAPEAERRVLVVGWDDFARDAALPGFDPAELVIETFGCRLPDAYDDALAAKREKRIAAGVRPPFYFNLDYLSAEAWIEDCHNIIGLHPRLDLPKLWFFPGFTERTGGLVIEEGYAERRAAFDRAAFLAGLGADPALRTLFVFCYPVNPLEVIPRGILKAGEPRNLLLPPGVWADTIEAEARSLDPRGETIRICRTPFLPQTEFDRLLWASDAAVIRGEDSFVRAQLAALPFLWSTYPTEDLAHRVKLATWLDRLVPVLPTEVAASYRSTSEAWVADSVTPGEFARFLLDAPALAQGFRSWSDALFARGDLGRRMLERAAQG